MKYVLRRYLILMIGLAVMAVGVAFSIKAERWELPFPSRRIWGLLLSPVSPM